NIMAKIDPLPSWNEGKTKQAILDFVARITTEGSRDFVMPNKRIAVFDNDGTLWCEMPLPVQLFFAVDTAKAKAEADPKLGQTEPFKSLLEGGLKAVAAHGLKAVAEIVIATHTGMTVMAFEQSVRDWLKTARHPKFKRPYTEVVFQPMLEL